MTRRNELPHAQRAVNFNIEAGFFLHFTQHSLLQALAVLDVSAGQEVVNAPGLLGANQQDSACVDDDGSRADLGLRFVYQA